MGVIISLDRKQQICDFLGKAGLPLQLRLDILDVFAQLRPAARVLVRPESEAKEVCAALLELGLSISVGRGVKWQPLVSSTTCHDWFTEDSENVTREPMALLYVSDSQQRADAARGADETADDEIFATALGYPPCCIRWVQSRGRVPEVGESISLYASSGKYDPLVWPGAMIVDAPLTAHYPCSTSCNPSRDLARARISALLQLGQDEILHRLAEARDMAYFNDSKSGLRAVAKSQFKPDEKSFFALPLMQSRSALGIPS